METLGEKNERERRDRCRELERDERVNARRASRHPQTRSEPHEERRRADQPDVHRSSSEPADGTRSCTSASPLSRSKSTTRRFGANDAASAAHARRPRSTSRAPPAENGNVRNLPERP